ncbi:hypothetical protein GCM10010275_70770 [Streptomyces litmocidini]|uniref:hypothetical protein n=1 Tax=Streptomyces litmocidini TaxID=67318 RepID=UPI00167CB89B|nr:hypothetical protein [Streptomyces litmocidini]GGV19004.1 hypothetical protein GCM10010275_70770 [Streptomyces litmocidini]
MSVAAPASSARTAEHLGEQPRQDVDRVGDHRRHARVAGHPIYSLLPMQLHDILSCLALVSQRVRDGKKPSTKFYRR